jgi:hypothetical protein
LLIASGTSIASGCSAAGENGSVCSIDCSVGQEALCIPSSGGNDPECMCVGGADFVQLMKSKRSKFQLALMNRAPKSRNVASLVGSAIPTPINVDVRAAINGLLEQYGKVAVTRNVETVQQTTRCHTNPGPKGSVGQGDPPSCDTVTRRAITPKTTQESLVANVIDVVQLREPVFANPVFTDLPSELNAAFIRAQNCSNLPLASASRSMSVSVGRSASLSLSNTLSKLRSAQASFSYKIPDTGLSLGGSVTVSETSTVGTTKMDGTNDSITQQTTASIQNLAPKTALAIEISAYKIQIDAAFNVQVIVDADLSANDKGLKRVSELFDEKQRTFTITGNLRTNNASDALVLQYSVPFDASKCPPSAELQVENYVPNKKDRLVEVKKEM